MDDGGESGRRFDVKESIDTDSRREREHPYQH